MSSSHPLHLKSPHYFEQLDTKTSFGVIFFCLLPAALWGVALFGFPAFQVLIVTIITTVLFDFGFSYIFRNKVLRDGNGLLIGLMLGMSMPPEVPLYIPIMASFFAIGFVKWAFGGPGNYWLNPVLAGRGFVFLLWTDPMTKWSAPRLLGQLDGMSAATHIKPIQAALQNAETLPDSVASFLVRSGYPLSFIDMELTGFLNRNIFSNLNAHLPTGYIDLFLGITPGSIGETSALLLLIGTVVLVARSIINWKVPFSFFFSYALFAWVFGNNGAYFQGDVLFYIFSGGFLLTIFYMATESVSTPMTPLGHWVFGLSAGILTFLFRRFGAYPEGAGFAVLCVNALVPFIDSVTQNKIRLKGAK